MEYDKELLKRWCNMEDWGTFLERHGGLNEFSSKEGFDFLGGEYFRMVEERIECCRELLKEHEDAFLCYVMAELFDRCNLDESPMHFYKWHVRYYALKSLEIDSNFTPAKELLKEVNSWIEFVGGVRKEIPEIKILFPEEGEHYYPD